MSTTGPIVSIEARPSRITIDLAKTALLVIDMQNDFGATGGMFDLAGFDLAPIRDAVPPTVLVVAAARAAGIRIVYVNEALRADLSDVAKVESPHRRMSQRMGFGNTVTVPSGGVGQIRIEHTWNTENLPELLPPGGRYHRRQTAMEWVLRDRP